MKREIAKGARTIQYNSLKFDLSDESQRLALTQQLGALEAELERLEYFLDSAEKSKNSPRTRNRFISQWIPRLMTFLQSCYHIGRKDYLTIEQGAVIGFLFSEIGLGKVIRNPRIRIRDQYYKWTSEHLS